VLRVDEPLKTGLVRTQFCRKTYHPSLKFTLAKIVVSEFNCARRANIVRRGVSARYPQTAFEFLDTTGSRRRRSRVRSETMDRKRSGTKRKIYEKQA